jgi:hypothetical protein
MDPLPFQNPPDDPGNLPIEEVRRFILVRFGVTPNQYWRRLVAEKYRALSEEERELLARHAEPLQNYLPARGPVGWGRSLTAMACLMVYYTRGLLSSLFDRSQSPAGMPSDRVPFAASWLQETAGYLYAYTELPRSLREELSGFANRRGVELPVSIHGAPEDILLALIRLESTIPLRPSEAVPEEALLALCPLQSRSLPRSANERLAGYKELSFEEARMLAGYIVRLWETDAEVYEEFAGEVLQELAWLFPGSMTGLHQRLLDRGISVPDELFRDADPDTRDRLIRMVEDNPQGKLAARQLAYIGDPVVQSAFHRWRRSPPRGDPNLAGTIEEYFVREAGWELTKEGSRRDLYYQDCYQLIGRTEASAADVPCPASVITPHEEQCPWCGRQLVTLFDMDLGTPQLSLFGSKLPDRRLAFLAPGWNRLRIATCTRCTLFTTIDTEVDGEGFSHSCENRLL